MLIVCRLVLYCLASCASVVPSCCITFMVTTSSSVNFFLRPAPRGFASADAHCLAICSSAFKSLVPNSRSMSWIVACIRFISLQHHYTMPSSLCQLFNIFTFHLASQHAQNTAPRRRLHARKTPLLRVLYAKEFFHEPSRPLFRRAAGRSFKSDLPL